MISFPRIPHIDQYLSVLKMNFSDPPVPIEKNSSENKIRSKIKVIEFNDWETSNEDQAAKGGKIEVDYPKVDADTIEDKLLNLQRGLEHLRKARLLKNGPKDTAGSN